MNLMIRCSKCNKEMPVTDSISPIPSELRISARSCSNVDCYDCSECELPKKYEKLKHKYAALANKLENLAGSSAEFCREIGRA